MAVEGGVGSELMSPIRGVLRALGELPVRALHDRLAVIDQSSESPALRVLATFGEEIVVWTTTVTPAGSPLPMPVWFLWDGAESVLMYSQEGHAFATSRRTRA